MTTVGAGKTESLFSDEIPKPLKRHGDIHIGTSGFSFADWQGAFYPKGLPHGQWLAYYASKFTVVEINATYYHIPRPEIFAGMAERTPQTFGFWVKLPGEATHGSAQLEPVMNSFLNSVQPLKDSGKLLGLLAQFPASFKPDQSNLERIVRIHDLVHDIPLAVEFRWDDWLTDETFAFLEDRRLIFVAVDLPTLRGLPSPITRTTGAANYVRFHGRNRQTWYNPQAGDRYDYEYSSSELEEWLPRVQAMDEMAPVSYLFFNNCHAGQAVKNARMMRELLAREFDMQI